MFICNNITAAAAVPKPMNHGTTASTKNALQRACQIEFRKQNIKRVTVQSSVGVINGSWDCVVGKVIVERDGGSKQQQCTEAQY